MRKASGKRGEIGWEHYKKQKYWWQNEDSDHTSKIKPVEDWVVEVEKSLAHSGNHNLKCHQNSVEGEDWEIGIKLTWIFFKKW